MVDSSYHERNLDRERREAEGMIRQIGGWWWPTSDEKARPVILRDVDAAIEAMLGFVRGRDCIVQAGGNVGVYPVVLADHFHKVITVEPDPENFACLWRNINARDSLERVRAIQGALGDEPGTCRVLEVEPHNCGAHRIQKGGAIPVLRIDDLALPACDAIWLDIEGFELAALKGAEETIGRFGPVVAFEDKGLGVSYGVEDGAIQAWLIERDYDLAGHIGRDKVFRRMA